MILNFLLFICFCFRNGEGKQEKENVNEESKKVKLRVRRRRESLNYMKDTFDKRTMKVNEFDRLRTRHNERRKGRESLLNAKFNLQN